MIGLKSTLGGTGNTLYSTAYHAARHTCAPSAPHRVPSLIQEDEVQWKQPCTAQNHFIPASTSHRSLGTNTDEARLDGANDQDNSDNYNHRVSFLLAHKPPTLLSFMVSAKQVSVKQPVNAVCCLPPSVHSGLSCATAPRPGRSPFKIWCSQHWEGSGGMTKGRETKDLQVA